MRLKHRRILIGERYKKGDEFHNGIEWEKIKYVSGETHKRNYCPCRRIVNKKDFYGK